MESATAPGPNGEAGQESPDQPEGPATRTSEFLTVSAAAALAGVAEETIRAWYDTGEIRGARTPQGHRLIDPTTLKQRVDYVSVGQAAEEFDLTPYVIRGWFDSGEVSGYRTQPKPATPGTTSGPGRRRISRSSLIARIAASREAEE
jgi:hypothetical protein